MNVLFPFHFFAFSRGTKERSTCFATARLWDDGVIQVEDTKSVMGVELIDASLFWRPVILFLKQRWSPARNSRNLAQSMFEIVQNEPHDQLQAHSGM